MTTFNKHLITIFLLLLLGCKPADKELEKFDALFETYVMPVPSDPAFFNIYKSDSSKKIVSSFFHYFDFPEDFLGFMPDSSSLKVIARYKIKFKNVRSYIISFYYADVTGPAYTCLYVYDSKKKKMKKPVILAYTAGASESSELFTESFMSDIDGDGLQEILSRIYVCNTTGEFKDFTDTLEALTWKDTGFVSFAVKDYRKMKDKFDNNIGFCGSK